MGRTTVSGASTELGRSAALEAQRNERRPIESTGGIAHRTRPSDATIVARVTSAAAAVARGVWRPINTFTSRIDPVDPGTIEDPDVGVGAVTAKIDPVHPDQDDQVINRLATLAAIPPPPDEPYGPTRNPSRERRYIPCDPEVDPGHPCPNGEPEPERDTTPPPPSDPHRGEPCESDQFSAMACPDPRRSDGGDASGSRSKPGDDTKPPQGPQTPTPPPPPDPNTDPNEGPNRR